MYLYHTMKHTFKLKTSNRTGFVKEATHFSQEYATKFHSVNVSAVIFKDNVNLITMFVGEWPKLQMWQ